MIVSNFANPDMVGHTGVLPAAIQAVEAVDRQLARIYKAVKQRNAIWIVTADHGNCETMVDPITGEPHTAHTTNPVPLIYVAEEAKNFRLRTDGSLRDISPTLLAHAQLGPAQGDERRATCASRWPSNSGAGVVARMFAPI